MNIKELNNLINEDASTPTSMADVNPANGYGKKLLDVIEKETVKTLASQICSVQPMKSPLGFVYAFTSDYQPNGVTERTTQYFPFQIVRVDDIGTISVGTVITFNTKSAVVLYVEGAQMLVKHTSNSEKFVIGDIVSYDSSNTLVTNVSSNRTAMRTIFPKFSDVANDLDLDVNQFNFSLNRIETFPFIKKLKSSFTRESLQDIQSQYGAEHANKVVLEIMKREVGEEIDKEIIEYLKTIARKKDTLVMNDSVSAHQSMPDAITEIFTAISRNAVEILNNTQRNLNCYAIVSPNVAGMIVSALQMIFKNKGDADEKNPKYIGDLGNIDIFLDSYATEDYILVGYKGKETGDAGLIYSPYSINMIETVNPKNGEIVYYYMLRNAYVRHPKDSGSGLDDSDFFVYQPIDTTFTNFYPTTK